MKVWSIAGALILTVSASGCSNHNNMGTPSPSSTASLQPSSSASVGTPTPGGGAVTAPPTPSSNVGNTSNAPLPTITKEQVDQLSMTSTYDDMVKLVGSKVKPLKEEDSKKTYEFAISNQTGYYVDFVYFEDGKIFEKKVFQK